MRNKISVLKNSSQNKSKEFVLCSHFIIVLACTGKSKWSWRLMLFRRSTCPWLWTGSRSSNQCWKLLLETSKQPQAGAYILYYLDCLQTEVFVACMLSRLVHFLNTFLWNCIIFEIRTVDLRRAVEILSSPKLFNWKCTKKSTCPAPCR